MRLAQGCTGASPRIVYSALVLSRGAWNEASPGLYWCSPGKHGNEASSGLVLYTGTNRSHSANLELLLCPLLELCIFQFCQTEVISLAYHPHNHSLSTSTLYPY